MADVGFIGFGTLRAFELPEGDQAPVAPAGRGRIRYNSATGVLELSVNEASYVPITTGSAAAVWEQDGTTVSLIDPDVTLVQVDLVGQPAFAPQYVINQVRDADDGGVGLVVQRNVVRRRAGDTGTTIAHQLQRQGGPLVGSFGLHFDGIVGDPFEVQILADRQPVVIATTCDWPNNTLAPISLEASGGVAGTGASEAGSPIQLRPGPGAGNGDGGNIDMTPASRAGAGVHGEVNVTLTRPSVGNQADMALPASFASLGVKDNATGQADVGTTYVDIAAWDTNGISLRATPDQANNEIRVEPGVWEVQLFVSVAGPAETRVQVAVFLEGVEQDISANSHVASAGEPESLACGGTIHVVAAPSSLRARIKSDNGAGVTVTINNAQLLARRVA